jgi:parallel beta-helix repeat protein
MSQRRSPGSVLMRIGIICALLALNLLTVSFAAATVDPTRIYVSPSGQDLDDTLTVKYGTFEKPYATLQYALKFAQPGTVIYLLDGVYPISQRIAWTTDVWPVTASGAPNAIISVQPYLNAQPIFDCAPITTADSCITIGVQYAEIKGLEIKNSPKSGIAVMGGSHISLRNNTIHHAKSQGIYVSDNDAGTLLPTDIVIDGNEVYNNALNYPLPLTPTSAPGGWDSGIGIKHVATNVTITNNRVHHNNGEGVGISAKVGTTVRGNVIHDNFSVNLYINGAHDATVERNFIYTADTQTTYYRYNAPANGISVSNEHDLDATTLSNLTIQNNIVVGGRYAFYYGGFERVAGGMKNSFIAHNTFYTTKASTDSGNSATVFIGLDKDSAGNPANNHFNTKFYNNAVMHGATSGAIRTIASAILSTSIEFKHNGWYTLGSPAAGTGSGLNDKTTNPLFVNPGGITPDSYKLTSASPLINAGAAPLINAGGATVAASDFWGEDRVQGGVPDIGADEVIALSPATPRFEAASYRIDESGLSNESVAQVTLKVVLPAAQPTPITLSYSTINGWAGAGADYQAVTGNVQFLAGQTTSQLIVIPLLEDGLAEEDEEFVVRLSNGASTVVTIATNDKITFSKSVVYVQDSTTTTTLGGFTTGPMAVVTAKLNAPSRLPVSVNLATRNGTALAGVDYSATSGTVSFEKTRYSYTTSTTSKFFSVPITVDTVQDDGEEFYIDAPSAVNAAIAQPSMTVITSNSGAQ